MAATDGFTQWTLGVLLGAIGGSVGTFVTQRTRLAMMQRDIDDVGKDRQRDRDHFDERVDMMDRRQMVMLRLVADVARKVGVDGRQFDDALVRMLTDDVAGEGRNTNAEREKER